MGGFIMDKYTCSVCGYTYDPEIGDSDAGIEAGTPLSGLPDSWECPMCGVGQEMFEKEYDI
jgi:rubredoxin